MENAPALSVSEASPMLPPPQKKRHILRSWLYGLGGTLILGSGVAAYFVLQVSSPAAGIPIPDLATGETAFTVPEASLMANATYTREDGQIVHYIDKPTVIEKAWTESNHHILIKFTDAFALTGERDPQEVILGRAFTTFCQEDVTHIKDAWYYVYTTPTFEEEKRGNFPVERFLLGDCRDVLNGFAARYNGNPKIKAGDLVYVAIPPAEVTKIETAKHGEGFWGNLRAATGPDTDNDGLLDLVEEKLGSMRSDYDSDLDGIGDGTEVAGGIVGTYHLAADIIGWSNPDTDWDGIHDATELGLAVSQDPDPSKSILFVADQDPATRTFPNAIDTDLGGVCDGPSIYTGACKDGQDNDGDGKKDFPEDAGCSSAEDRSEDERFNCTGGEDLNANGKIDDDETDPNKKDDDSLPPLPPPPGDSCKNGIDDDGDTLIDLLDAGCANADDTNEGDGLTDLEVKKTGPAEAADDSKVTYIITVTNKGPDAITSAAEILDHVPAGLEYIDAESHAECDPTTNNNNVQCGNIKLAKDASVSFLLVFRVKAAASDLCGKEVTNKAFASATPQGDPNDANNTSSVTTKLMCTAPPPPFCGNSVMEDTEECDDGNAVNTDSCNECKLTFCGDRIVQNPNGKRGAEECDEDSPICTDDCRNIQLPQL